MNPLHSLAKQKSSIKYSHPLSTFVLKNGYIFRSKFWAKLSVARKVSNFTTLRWSKKQENDILSDGVALTYLEPFLFFELKRK